MFLLVPVSVDLNAADTGVQLKTAAAQQDRKQPGRGGGGDQKQEGCGC